MSAICRLFQILPSGVVFKRRLLSSTTDPVQKAIEEKLTKLFKPTHLKIVNESRLHASGKGAETHFRISIVSKDFENASDVLRHRLINSALVHEFASGLHALSILAKAPSEELPPATSVPCAGKTKANN